MESQCLTMPFSRAKMWSIYLGNFFEHYDTALFGFLSVFLAPLIFPQQDELTALILTYAMIPLGMLAKPLGAIIFGYIGDYYGRGQALFLSLAGMSVVSGFIACTPTYQQAGMLAPIIFCFGRALQNFFSAGESVGGAIYLLENTQARRHDLLSSIYGMTTIGGILLASAGVFLLGWKGIIYTGWRLLYLIGCLTAFFGLMIRQRVPVDSWNESKTRQTRSCMSLLKDLWIYRKALLLIVIASGFSYANYSIALVLINGFIPLVTSVSKEEVMGLNTLLLILDFCALPFFGWVSSRITREKVMLFASLAVVASGLPLFMMLPDASLMGILGIRICLVLLGVAFSAPFHAWAQQLVPKESRYSVISFGYSIGSQLLGGPTAAFSLWLYKSTGVLSSISWYWLALALLSSLSVALSLKPRTLIIPARD